MSDAIRTAEELSYDDIVELIVDADDTTVPWSASQDRKIVLALRELQQRRIDERVAINMASVDTRPLRKGETLERWEDMSREELLASVKEVVGELDYAYRCITSGYRQGVFDFHLLKDKAFEFTGLEER
jgi:hypothetical protein